MSRVLNVLIASPLEPEYVERIAAVSDRLDVHHRPDLIPSARFPADHRGAEFQRTADQEAEWRTLLKQANILFDFDHTHLSDLSDLAPKLKWIQASSAGVGQLVRQYEYAQRMPELIVTTASGVHAQPLAEFCLMVMIAFCKNLNRIVDQQRRTEWTRFSGTDLEGRTATILGLGNIGSEVARVCRALRMNVIGIKRDIQGITPESLHVDKICTVDELDAVLVQTDVLVVILPHTPETEHLIGREQLERLKPNAVLINIGRGAVVDELALIESLQSGHLCGAGLDVFEHEPLPADSPLWTMPNVLVSPHCVGASDHENGRITDLFCRNLKLYLAGEPMENRLDMQRLY